MTIIEFLLARIEEDEALARAATQGPWEVDAMDAGHSRYEMNVWVAAGEGDTICDMDGFARSQNESVAKDDGYKDAQHIARHDPARVLAECAAKRAIIALDEYAEGSYWDTLACLAAIYAPHPDYRQEWAL